MNVLFMFGFLCFFGSCYFVKKCVNVIGFYGGNISDYIWGYGFICIL